MNEQYIWEPLPDGIAFHERERAYEEWIGEFWESIAFAEVRQQGTVLATGSMPLQDEIEVFLPDDLRLCRRVQVATDQDAKELNSKNKKLEIPQIVLETIFLALDIANDSAQDTLLLFSADAEFSQKIKKEINNIKFARSWLDKLSTIE